MMDTIIDLLERSCEKFPDHPYLWEKKEGKYVARTYRETKERVLDIAAGLLLYGLKKGQRVALLSEGCNDWVCMELGVLYAGGINVPLSIKLTDSELLFRINHAGVRFLFVSAYYWRTVRRVVKDLQTVEKIFVWGNLPQAPEQGVPMDTFIQLGQEWRKGNPGRLQEAAAHITGEDVADISYTSGTTAEPKGIMLTHANYVANVLQSDYLIQIPSFYRILLFLPWDHSFAHTVGLYSFMYNGASVAAVDFGNSPLEYLRNIPLNMQEIKPHVLLSVPAVARNFRKTIETTVRKKGRLLWQGYQWGLRLAYFYYGNGNQEAKGGKILFYPLVKLFDLCFFVRIRNVFGGNLRFFVGGGALLDVELQKYYRALGIPMYQGYGLSEASPVISSNTPARHKFGSSGRVAQPMELKICDAEGNVLPAGKAGEIVVRGDNVMKGYWRNDKGTREVIKEGWLHTGDLGYLDTDGFLYVSGRFKSLLVANDGEKYSPEGIEEAIVEKSECIDFCMLYNNQCAYTSALVVPNRQVLREYLKHKKVEWGSVEGYKLMLTRIYEELMEFRHGGKYQGIFPERWLPAVVAVLPETLSEQKGTLNSTAKMVRHRMVELYKEELEYVYTPEGKDILNSRNTCNIKKLFTE